MSSLGKCFKINEYFKIKSEDLREKDKKELLVA